MVIFFLESCPEKGSEILNGTLGSGAERRPNVLMILVDDLNDWVGYMGGHPNAITPNIDKLARRGTSFLRAHANAPICGPSRASMLTGIRPSTSGIYFHVDDRDLTSMVRNDTTGISLLPNYFENYGYKTYGVGKVFHLGDKAGVFDEYGGLANFGPKPPRRFNYDPEWFGKPKGTSTDWGVYPENDSLTYDYRIADWAIERLKRTTATPFFMAVGFMRPHVPWYTSQYWIDIHPLDSIQTPSRKQNDWNDIPAIAASVTDWPMMPEMKWMQRDRRWEKAVRAYLASVSFVDQQIGRVLEALEATGKESNTIVLLVSDHGYHLGEKDLFQKGTLWQRSSHIPMIWAGPGINDGNKSHALTSLIDVYPTLSELCELETPSYLEGQSLAPILSNNSRPMEHYVLTNHGPKNYSVYHKNWHFISYFDGSMELYDLEEDPNEWYNLIDKKELGTVVERLKLFLPSLAAPNSDISQLCATPLYFDPVKCDQEP